MSTRVSTCARRFHGYERQVKPSRVGEKFNRWAVVADHGAQIYRGRRLRTVVVRCDCGTYAVRKEQQIVYGHSKSCGCWKMERASRARTHGLSHRNKRNSPTYNSWAQMRQRCANERDAAFKYYGARGISVCERWLGSFANFLADMGERPVGTSLDRIDVNGNYEPGNCRWATKEQQAQNTRRTVFEAHEPDQVRWLFDEEGWTAREVADLLGVNVGAVNHIVHCGGWR